MMNQLLNEKLTRRRAVLTGAAALAGGAALMNSTTRAADVPGAAKPREKSAADEGTTHAERTPLPPGEPGLDYNPVHTPNGETLAWKVVEGVKVFHLIVGEVEQEMAPGLKAKLWGYNGRSPGPTIEVVEGDRVRFYVTNTLPAPTTIHWHGLLLPNGMDGVSALNQRPIEPGETFAYEFTIRQHGTAMYHSHFDEMTQQALGLTGMFVIHPRDVPPEKRPDRDFVLLSHEWKIDPGTYRPDPMEMTDFNILTFNGKAFPGTAPLVAKLRDRVRIRIGNLSPMSHHPIHLHGYQFKITETDGGPIPESAQWPETTVLVAVGSTRTIEFVADEPGDWAMHCHMSHHTMNQMGHGIPNMIGVDPEGFDEKVRPLLPAYMTMGQTGMGGMAEHMIEMGVPENSIPMVGAPGPFAYIDMGGMFTIFKVRRDVEGYDDPGWYEHPAGTVADAATAEALKRDGIDLSRVNVTSRVATPPAQLHLEDRADPHGKHQGGHGQHRPSTSPAAGAAYTCPHHPEVVSDKPARCPKCGMKLVPKK
jgi:FtsP/CotA-like multicopper oxidase with cupredoxin domain